MNGRRGLLVVLGVALAVGLPGLGVAQVRRPGQGQAQRMELERRLQQRFGQVVQRRLGLDTEKMKKVQEVMGSFQEERRALARAEASVRYRLRDPALEEMSEADARAFLEEMISVRKQELELYEREQAELLKVLSPTQLVLFYRLRDDLGQQIQRLRQGRGPGGGIGMGGNILPAGPPPTGRGGGG